VRVTNTRKREPDWEYVKEAPYITTTVPDLVTPPGLTVQSVTIDQPAPGKPAGSLYRYPTAPDSAHPYRYNVPDSAYPFPMTVFIVKAVQP